MPGKSVDVIIFSIFKNIDIKLCVPTFFFYFNIKYRWWNLLAVLTSKILSQYLNNYQNGIYLRYKYIIEWMLINSLFQNIIFHNYLYRFGAFIWSYFTKKLSWKSVFCLRKSKILQKIRKPFSFLQLLSEYLIYIKDDNDHF